MFSSSGILKRGLAAAAVSAMTVTGLQGLTSVAFADPGTSQAGGADAVALAEPGANNGTITTKNDGTNTTYRLEAAGGTNVASVRFEYQIGAGQVNTIATATRGDDGFFATEWNPTVVDGASVTVRAVGLSSAGTVLSNSTRTATVNSQAESLNITDGTALGVFQQPYGGANGAQLVRLRGTLSQSAANRASVNASFWNGANQTWTAAGTVPTSGAAPAAFDGLVDITGYTYGATDQVLLGADNGASSDAEAFSLYKQTITTVAATADRTNLPSGQTANVTVTVTDQNGAPIGGARVASSNGGNAAFTNSQGQATFTQGAGSATYYADATAATGYQAELGDKQSGAVTITQYAAVQTKLAATSADGAAFDFDEYSTGDIAVQVQDQNGANYDPTLQSLTYHWVITPFNGATAITTADQVQPIENGGRYNVAFPTGQPSGTYTLFASLGADVLGNGAIASSQLLSVKAGDSDIVLGTADPVQAAAGTQAVVAGKLALPDGTALANRLIDVAYNNNGGNANIVLADGTTGASRQVTTDSTGAFSVTVKDVAVAAGQAQPTESGTLTATTAATPNAGFASNNAQETATTGVQFIASVAPTAITVTPAQGGQLRPGVASGTYQVHVDNAAGSASNVTVALSTDHGFFTDGTASPAAASGGQAGGLTSLGSTINVTTNGNGNATFRLGIARDTGFDDDGAVTATVTASAGSLSGKATQLWDSSNPLNGGTVDIKRSAVQTVGVLPKAPTNESVDYDVYATDQFGNLTDVDVAVTPGGVGQVNGGSSDTVTSEFSGDSPQVEITSAAAGNEAPVATWTAPTTTYTAAPPATVGGTKTLTDTGETTAWYVINFAASKFTLTHDVASPAVGGTVIETYTAIDQNGEPIRDQQVSFFRAGPDVLQDGTPASTTAQFGTGENGKATYVFSGAAAGTATLQALITDANGADGTDGQPVGPSRATDTVVFGATPTTPTKTPAVINADLEGSSKGAKDKLSVSAPGADGAKVTLYKKVKGELKRIKVATLNGAGAAKFSVKDRNGTKVTKYRVVVDPTSDTQADTSKINLK